MVETQAYWIEVQDWGRHKDYLECSHCGGISNSNLDNIYCNKCGKKMQEEIKELKIIE